MTRRLRLGLVVLLAIACSGDDIPAGASTTTGTYSLRTVNGAALPYTVQTGPLAGTVIVDEVLKLYYGGTFSGARHSRTTASGSIETTATTGTYSLLGNSITFRINETGGTRVAIGDGLVMTIVEPGVSLRYSK